MPHCARLLRDPSEKHVEPEQGAERGLKVPVPGKPALGCKLEEEPLPPDTVTIPDSENDFGQFADRLGMKGVAPFIIQRVRRTKRMAQRKIKTVQISVDVFSGV